jgi:glycosyltransferase involved in cell wall biosynthesis
MPDRRFLGILPYYGEKSIPPAPENIEWIPFQNDVRDILKRTRILLVPSYYESFGRVAVEAMINGIPVIYSAPATNSIYPGGSTEGLEAWIRPVGIGLPRDATQEWADAVRALDDPEAYSRKSEESRAHIEAMNLFGEGARIAELVEGFSRQHPVVKKSSMAIEPPKSSGPQTPQVVAMPREPTVPGRAGFGFSNGRLRIQR